MLRKWFFLEAWDEPVHSPTIYNYHVTYVVITSMMLTFTVDGIGDTIIMYSGIIVFHEADENGS